MPKRPPRSPKIPTKPASLAAWLLGTEAGREAMALAAPRWMEESEAGEALLRQAVEQRLAGRESVLVVVESCGRFGKPWIEVYADRTVQVHIAQKLDSTADPTDVDEYLSLSLPKRYRRLYWPVNLRSSLAVGRVTATEELKRRERLEELRLIRHIGEEVKREAS